MKIICIGRNYIDHIDEMKTNMPKQPLFFMKGENALIYHNLPFFIPDFSQNIHYECEFVIRICKIGKMIEEQFASNYFDAITLGIDFTARDIQQKCIEHGEPWEIAKSFDSSAPVGNFIPKSMFENLKNLNFKLTINNNIVQSSNSKNMIFSFEQIIAHVSKYITLKIGDLIFTGTPAGVGQIKQNDVLDAWIENDKVLSVSIK